MYKNRLKSLMAMGLVLLLAMCTKYQDVTAPSMGARADLTGSDMKADGIAAMYFSTDNGVTYSLNLLATPGQKYWAKVLDTKTNKFVKIGDNIYTFDWSGSTPKPAVSTLDSAQFTYSNPTDILVKVANVHCDYDASIWTGAWGGDEVGACCGGTDANNITADPGVANRFWMDNFWGDHVSVYFDLTPSTTFFDQILTLPAQTTSENGAASGIGTYNQCTGTFTIATTYTIGGSTYKWQYNFHKP